MSGIYIHVPFCLSKCYYCAFYSMPSLKRKDEYLESLRQEMVARKDYLHGMPVSTVYFGGGTPSLLTPEELKTILNLLHDHFPVEADAELTLEANPDTLSPEYLEALSAMGFNRLSIGIQSFFDDDLQYLGRRHDSRHARQCIDWARSAGFDNLSLDLIYGLPTSTADQWNRNLDMFFATGAPHLSAYALTLEPNSILTKRIAMGKAQPVEETAAVRDYGILCQRAAEEGFVHYEISNFCRPGFRSKHNSSYWFQTPYLGLGPAAHSFDGKERRWNAETLDGIRSEYETLTPENAYNEYVMLRLRTMWGLDLKYIRREMGDAFAEHCERQAAPLVAQGRLSRTREFLYLTDPQMLFADGIAAALFY